MIRPSVTASPGNAVHVRGIESFAVNKRRGLISMLAAEQVRNQHRRIDTREGVDGSRYKASKRAEAQGGQTLRDKGHMMGALGVLTSTADEATIGFKSALEAKKALWHQYGTRRGLPARPFFGCSERDARTLQGKANDWLTAHAKREMK